MRSPAGYCRQRQAHRRHRRKGYWHPPSICFSFGFVEHRTLRRVRFGAATEALASVQIELFELCLKLLLLCLVCLFQLSNAGF